MNHYLANKLKRYKPNLDKLKEEIRKESDDNSFYPMLTGSLSARLELLHELATDILEELNGARQKLEAYEILIDSSEDPKESYERFEAILHKIKSGESATKVRDDLLGRCQECGTKLLPDGTCPIGGKII